MLTRKETEQNFEKQKGKDRENENYLEHKFVQLKLENN